MSSTDADVLAQLQQVPDGRVEVLRIKRALVERGGVLVLVQLDVELHAAHAREIVLARIEEHALEQRGRGIQRRRIARTQLAVDFDQRFVRRLDGVLAQRGADHVADVVALGEEDLELGRRRLRIILLQLVGGELAVGFEQHFAGRRVDDVGGGECAFQIGGVDFDLGDLRLAEFPSEPMVVILRPECAISSPPLSLMACASFRPSRCVGVSIPDHSSSAASCLAARCGRRCRTCCRISSSDRRPRARRKIVPRNLRLRSMRT